MIFGPRKQISPVAPAGRHWPASSRISISTWAIARPVAVVVLADNAVLELSELTAHCRTRLAGFKVPKQLVIRDSLPRNPSGKVLKRVLRAELEATA